MGQGKYTAYSSVGSILMSVAIENIFDAVRGTLVAIATHRAIIQGVVSQRKCRERTSVSIQSSLLVPTLHAVFHVHEPFRYACSAKDNSNVDLAIKEVMRQAIKMDHQDAEK